jgi:hypothetical protein
MSSTDYTNIVALIAFEKDTETLENIVKMARGQIEYRQIIERDDAKIDAMLSRG